MESNIISSALDAASIAVVVAGGLFLLVLLVCVAAKLVLWAAREPKRTHDLNQLYSEYLRLRAMLEEGEKDDQ